MRYMVLNLVENSWHVGGDSLGTSLLPRSARSPRRVCYQTEKSHCICTRPPCPGKLLRAPAVRTDQDLTFCRLIPMGDRGMINRTLPTVCAVVVFRFTDVESVHGRGHFLCVL